MCRRERTTDDAPPRPLVAASPSPDIANNKCREVRASLSLSIFVGISSSGVVIREHMTHDVLQACFACPPYLVFARLSAVRLVFLLLHSFFCRHCSKEDDGIAIGTSIVPVLTPPP